MTRWDTAQLRKWLILSHRYLGIVLGLFFVVWFVSGIGMIYAKGMPSLADEQRLARMAPMDLASVRMTPGEAAEKAGLDGTWDRVTLLMVMHRPAYRFGGQGPEGAGGGSGSGGTVFADTGERMLGLDSAQAHEVAARFMDVPSDRVRYDRLLTRADQWTITQRAQLPLLSRRRL